MPKPRLLTPEQARRTLAHRFAPRVDRLRQLATRFGVRPYTVTLRWSRWSGEERGQGTESIVAELPLLPTPKVQSLDNVAARFFSGGILPVGSLRVTLVSALYTQDQLTGLAIPTVEFARKNDPPLRSSAANLPPKPSLTDLPEPFDFWWQIQEDGRGDDPAEAMRYRLAAWPHRAAGRVSWEVLLERTSANEERDGALNSGFEND